MQATVGHLIGRLARLRILALQEGMPERPDLEYVIAVLRENLVGAQLAAVDLDDPVVLRRLVSTELGPALVGRQVGEVLRQGHFLRLRWVGAPAVELAIHPMLAGRFSLGLPSDPLSRDLALRLTFADGRQLRYRDDRQMGKVYLLDPADEAQVPGLSHRGLDVLSPSFTVEALRRLCRGRREQVKVFLMDKSALDSFGNAYADEALYAAGIHPKARVSELSPSQVETLHGAMVQVLAEATAEIARRRPPLDQKLRDFLRVRLRKGAPCPRCGQAIRVVGVLGHDAYHCPSCQPDLKARGLIDWRRLPGPGVG
jgi:formamidopyrimidine-DNA glycosylase